MSEHPTPHDDVLAPGWLLGIQTMGGLLAAIPIWDLHRIADLTERLHGLLLTTAIANVLVSGLLWMGVGLPVMPVKRAVDRLGQTRLCRIVICWDMIMLGLLVRFTGGAESSVFAPQFAAVLPMAMLVKDSPGTKGFYTAVFLLVFLIGFVPLAGGDWHEYRPDATSLKTLWFVIYFFIFSFSPLVYTVADEVASGRFRRPDLGLPRPGAGDAVS